MFRHRGERKVKTVEEDAEEVASKTAELLNEEGEELMGKQRKCRVTAKGQALLKGPASGRRRRQQRWG